MKRRCVVDPVGLILPSILSRARENFDHFIVPHYCINLSSPVMEYERIIHFLYSLALNLQYSTPPIPSISN
jgi:hypothetical protein